MAAVVWTDVVQMAIYVGGTVVALLTLGSHVRGGWPVIHSVASAVGKFHIFNFALNLTTTYTFWAGVIGGTFLTMASHGTDQLMVQRLLAARNLRESRAALLSSGVVIFLQFWLFLLIGAGLSTSSISSIRAPLFRTNDHIFPTFIVREMPIGIAGLLVAAILAAAMSNLSAALNSLSSTTVVDFYTRLRPDADNRERAMIAKSSTVLWALVLFAIAVYSVKAGGKGHVVEIGLSIASVAYGCLLGVFLLGTLTRFATELGASIGMICGFILNLWIWQGAFPVHLGPITIPHIAWTWYVVIGAAATFLIGAFASLFLGKRTRTERTAAVAALLLLCLCLPLAIAAQKPSHHQASTPGPATVATPNFTAVSDLINQGIAEHRLPHARSPRRSQRPHCLRACLRRPRAARGEPDSTVRPSPAERMTENTGLRHGVAFQVSLHRNRHHATLRTSQAQLRRARRADPSRVQSGARYRARKGHRAHAAHAYLRRAR